MIAPLNHQQRIDIAVGMRSLADAIGALSRARDSIIRASRGGAASDPAVARIAVRTATAVDRMVSAACRVPEEFWMIAMCDKVADERKPPAARLPGDHAVLDCNGNPMKWTASA